MKYRDIQVGKYYFYHSSLSPNRTMAYVVDKDLISTSRPGYLKICLWTEKSPTSMASWSTAVYMRGPITDADLELPSIVRPLIYASPLTPCPMQSTLQQAAGVIAKAVAAGSSTQQSLPSAPIFYDKVMVGHYYWTHAGFMGFHQATLIYIDSFKISISTGYRTIEFFTWENRTGTWMRASMIATNPTDQWKELDRHEPNPPHFFGSPVTHVATPNPPNQLIATHGGFYQGIVNQMPMLVKEFAAFQAKSAPVCECGVDKCGGVHSSWCPKGKSCSPSS